jgi:hypothetical protein
MPLSFRVRFELRNVAAPVKAIGEAWRKRISPDGPSFRIDEPIAGRLAGIRWRSIQR